MLRRVSFAAAALALLLPAGVRAQATLIDGLGGAEGFGTQCLSPNDDGSSVEIDLTTAFPGGLEFFGRRHATAYVNTNGNITFTDSLSQFTPEAFPIADQPMIAPYWADVDIRGSECSFGGTGAEGCSDPATNGVWWYLEPGRMIVTWDEVGYYSCNDTNKMSFQLILTEARYCGAPGDFDVEFRYNRCEWEVGGASGDINDNGVCDAGETDCTPAQVGFDAGNLTDFVSVMGSRMDGIRTRMCMESNIGIPGVWRFQIRRGEVSCPDAGEACDTELMGVCGEGRTQCVGAGTECQQVLEAGDESCNGADDDCDGSTDEGDDLCSGAQLCDRGVCIDPCFEGGCPEGEVCTDTGVCAEMSCEDVECDPGQRCIGGSCVSACDGVTCPAGQTCRLGRCQDLCDTVSCDACQVCVDGTCQLHCIVRGCPDGQACEETGECVEEDCLGVRCGPGRACHEGRCADACEGVVCPMGEVCRVGECTVDTGPPDAGMPPGTDGGSSGDDAGTTPGDDASTPAMDGGVGPDAGDGGGDDGGCGCRSAGASTRSTPALWLLSALGLLFFRRRRA